MTNLVFVIIITAIAFWLGRRTKHSPIPIEDPFLHSAIHSTALPTEASPARIPMNGQRAFALVFIGGWIIAWSAGIGMAAMFFFSSLGKGIANIFIGGWLIAASAGWLYAASVIYKLVTGKPVKSRNGRTY